MTALALRLRWALLRGGLRSGPGAGSRQLGLVLGGVLGLVLSSLALVGVAALHGRPSADDAAVLLLTGLVVGWTALPVLTFSSDDLLDASKLALLPLSTRDVLTLHGVGALLGVAPVATAVALVGVVLGTGGGPGSYAVALLALPLELALCIALSRTVATSLSRLLRSRRGRDLGVALTALVAVSGQLLNPVLQRASRSHDAQQQLHRVADALAQLPPGLLATAPRLAREGRPGAAAVHLLLGAATVAVLLWLWARALRRSEDTVDATSRPDRRPTALTPRALGRLLPAGRVGAVAGKDLRYLARDPRRIVQVVTGAVFPALFVVVTPALSDGGGLDPRMVFATCGIGLLASLAGSNRFGQDGTATWMLVGSGADRQAARRDLLGGDLALALVVVPLMALSGVVIAAVCDGWRYLAAAECAGLAVFATAVGATGLVAVLAPFPLPEGARNAFSNGGGGQGLTAALLSFAMIGAVAVTSLPLLLLPAVHGGPVLLLGPLYGLAAGSLAREVAARRWADRGPEVLLRLVARPG